MLNAIYLVVCMHPYTENVIILSVHSYIYAHNYYCADHNTPSMLCYGAQVQEICVKYQLCHVLEIVMS